MRFKIKHELNNRLRVTLLQEGLERPQAYTIAQGDMLTYYFKACPAVTGVSLYPSTGGVAISFVGDVAGKAKAAIYELLHKFSFASEQIKALVPENTGSLMNAKYKGKLVKMILRHLVTKYILPTPFRLARRIFWAGRFVFRACKALRHRHLDVSVLDATAITASMLRRDYSTAGSVMFLLRIGDLLEDWTRHKSVNDLAQSMSLNVSRVWVKTEDSEVELPLTQVKQGDLVIVKMGSIIPLDGVVAEGEGAVNQASMTGEALPVVKTKGVSVYAGTVLAEGELVIRVAGGCGTTRYERVVNMIKESEKLKSTVESEASHLADRLVPYSFLGTALAYLLTRDVNKALSVLMVDFSCALKLAMPLSVLSAMKECSDNKITVKGGKYLESVAAADTIVFDKTGTLTKAQPKVAEIISFKAYTRKEVLAYAACLEEHFPHSVANAIVRQAAEEGVNHEEMHSKVEYIVAHGIASTVDEKRIVIGSSHFVFEDEHCVVPKAEEEKYQSRPEEYSHIFMAIGGELAAIICINDPLRQEAKDTLLALRGLKVKKLVMMTGDSRRTAGAIAGKLSLDEYYSEVLPEDKAKFILAEKAKGRKVIMVGDGINDSPALSAADAGIAVSEGADIAREIANITIAADDLRELVTLRKISMGLMSRINWNYKFVVGFNCGLIALGVIGILPPASSAWLHNISTLGVGLHSMTKLLPEPVV